MSENADPFIPSWIDDAGLTVSQFRVLCHLFRRGKTFSNAATIAKTCRLKRNTVFDVLGELETAGLIRREPRPGQTTLIEPVPFGDTGRNGDPTRLGIRDPTRLGIHKGNPIKGIPLRKSQRGGKTEISIAPPFPSASFLEAWTDWEQHRREIKKKLTPTSVKQQFSKFAEMGEIRAIAAINHSIEKGWQGIFEPSGPTAATPAPAGAVTINGRVFKS